MTRDPSPLSAISAIFMLPVLSALALPAVAQAADLELDITNIRSDQGSLMVALYDSAASFGKTAVQQLMLPAVVGSTTTRITGLPAGSYAITMYQDRNGNGKIDSNLMGIPTEPYGMSSGGAPGAAPSRLGPPSWDGTHFALPESGARIQIQLTD